MSEGSISMMVTAAELSRSSTIEPVRFTPEQKRRMRDAPGNPSAHRIVAIRRTVQLLLFGLFLLFFFMTTVTGSPRWGVPKDLFMMLDYLVVAKNFMASHHLPVYALGPALLILILTIFGGRIFCGWICPLGTLIDITDRTLYRRGKILFNRRRSETRRFRNWKFIYLLIGLGALVWGVDILAFGDPLSLITRTFTFWLYPPIAFLWNQVLSGLDQVGFDRFAYLHFGWNLSEWHIPGMVYDNNVIVGIILLGVLGLSMFQERFWCRNLCPYGALLGLMSRAAVLRHYIHMPGCIHCKKCEIQSRHGCYENLDRRAAEPVTHAITECIQCFRCETICPTDVIQIRAGNPMQPPADDGASYAAGVSG